MNLEAGGQPGSEIRRLRGEAEALRRNGQFREAGRLLNQALALDPRNASTILEIGRVLNAEDRKSEAIDAFKAALRVRPELTEGWFELGNCHAAMADYQPARAALQQARSLAPRDPGPTASLAYLEVRQGNYATARELAREALNREADHPLASLAMADADLNARDFDSARTRLEEFLARMPQIDELRQIAYGLLGDALDGLGQVDAAFAAYGQMNELFERLHAPRFASNDPARNHLEFVRRLTSWFERQDERVWQKPAVVTGEASPAKRHIFLFGYPRSGTTLAENVLATLPDVRALEERPTLQEADLALLRNEQALDLLAGLESGLAENLRSAYWQRVRAEVPDFAGRIFVDKAPLHGIKLPMISRLFPDAVYVLCRRDPRDVVLSCFRRNFRPNAATYQMTNLANIARHYSAVMQLMELHLKVLPLQVHTLDYRALVEDFEGTTRALAGFVGAQWSEAAFGFHRTAGERNVRTASAPQVRRGLYDGTRQWWRYRAYMDPVLPVLEPWVTRFGYDV